MLSRIKKNEENQKSDNGSLDCSCNDYFDELMGSFPSSIKIRKYHQKKNKQNPIRATFFFVERALNDAKHCPVKIS